MVECALAAPTHGTTRAVSRTRANTYLLEYTSIKYTPGDTSWMTKTPSRRTMPTCLPPANDTCGAHTATAAVVTARAVVHAVALLAKRDHAPIQPDTPPPLSTYPREGRLRDNQSPANISCSAVQATTHGRCACHSAAPSTSIHSAHTPQPTTPSPVRTPEMLLQRPAPAPTSE